MSIEFNLPINACESQTAERGPRTIGEILPDVLAVYFRRLEANITESVASRRTATVRFSPRFSWPTETVNSPLMAATS